MRSGCFNAIVTAIIILFVISFIPGLTNSAPVSAHNTPTTTPVVTPHSSLLPTSTPTSNPTISPSTSSLRLGSSGEAVTSLQRRLNELGFSVGTVDGVYGAKTEHAVTEFQKTSGLTTDGIAGKMTLAMLYSTSAPSAPSSYRTSSGSSNNSAAGSNGNASNLNKYNDNVTSSYVGNSATGKFHRQSCSSAKKIKPSNRIPFDSRDAALNAGYNRCKRCNP